MLHIDQLSFAYKETPVLRDLSLQVARGDAVLIRGASGCGKSTLLRLLARLEAPQRGSILLDGIDVTTIPAPAYRRRVAYLQQLPVMVEGSIRDNLLLAFRYAGDPPPDDGDLRMQLAEVELQDITLDAAATELSVGQKQRLALLRLLSMHPDVLLLDEPTASLDSTSAAQLMNVVKRQLDAHALTLLIVSHQDLPFEERRLRLLHMREGHLEEHA
ncbi:MAG: ATP-binding cassette domain-containing protein [Bacteroidetes bacterium]|nr:ATP-binding cassette domain-containing protein [Bacteroidota bacterium]